MLVEGLDTFIDLHELSKQNGQVMQFTGNYRFLGLHWRSNVIYEGIIFPTALHAFLASKEKSYIRRCEYRGNVANVLSLSKRTYGDDEWEANKYHIMYEIQRSKFSNPALKERLLNTPVYIMHGNLWHETLWGVCACRDCRLIGNNLLGKILMKIRKEEEET